MTGGEDSQQQQDSGVASSLFKAATVSKASSTSGVPSSGDLRGHLDRDAKLGEGGNERCIIQIEDHICQRCNAGGGRCHEKRTAGVYNMGKNSENIFYNLGNDNDGVDVNSQSQGQHCRESVRWNVEGCADKSGNRDDFNMSGQLNPILIPSIINHIASYLSCTDLKRCRLLNSFWYDECSKFLRQKGLIKLTSKTKIVHFTSQFHKKPKFCQNFYFEIVKGIEADKFLDKFGPYITYLKLDFSKSTGYHLSAEEFHELVFIKLPKLEELSLVGCIAEEDHFLPEDKRTLIIKSHNSSNNSSVSISSFCKANNFSNSNYIKAETHVPPPLPRPALPLLKRLEIYLYNSSGKNVSKHQFLIELLSCVPNMEKISVPKVPRMLSFGMPLLHTLITSEDLHFRKLQHLDMDIALYNGSIDVLKSKGYPLKYLNAEINSTVSGESLHSLLKTYGKTLVALQLKFPRSPVASSEFMSSTSFKALKSITLHGYKGSLKFLEDLADLQAFGLIDNAFTVAMRRDDFIQPLKAEFNYKMIWTDWHEEAYCFDSVNSSDAQLLRVFSKNFLNLRSLNLPHLNDNDLRIIYQNFSHSLQELTMENSLCSDYGLTGICHGIISDLEEMGKIEQYRTQLFIGNLKRLRRLEILTPSNEMSDSSILYGIVYCQNLKVFIIRNAPITDRGLRRLVDMLQLEKLETTMCANIRGAGVKYALQKMSKREMTFLWNKYQNRLTSACINRFLNGNAAVTCTAP